MWLAVRYSLVRTIRRLRTRPLAISGDVFLKEGCNPADIGCAISLVDVGVFSPGHQPETVFRVVGSLVQAYRLVNRDYHVLPSVDEVNRLGYLIDHFHGTHPPKVRPVKGAPPQSMKNENQDSR